MCMDVIDVRNRTYDNLIKRIDNEEAYLQSLIEEAIKFGILTDEFSNYLQSYITLIDEMLVVLSLYPNSKSYLPYFNYLSKKINKCNNKLQNKSNCNIEKHLNKFYENVGNFVNFVEYLNIDLK